MKVDNEALTLIQTVVKTAQLVDIHDIVIEPGRVRGIDKNRTVVLFQEDSIPELSIGSIGLNRTDTLISRMEIAQSQQNFNVQAVIDDAKGFARSLTLKAKGVKIEYRCGNPTHIKAPRIINDTMIDDVSIPLNAELVDMLQKGVAAMDKATHVTIFSNADGVSFELQDDNNDVFDYTFADAIEEHFSHKYPVKTLLPLFKHDSESSFEIGHKGILRFMINELGIYVLPGA